MKLLQRRYYYYGEEAGRCDSYSFSDKSSQLNIGVDGADFLLTLVVLLFWLLNLRKTRRILRWYNFGLCLALYLLSSGLNILDQVLWECNVLETEDYLKLYIAPQFFYSLSELILLGIVLLPINNAFLVLLQRPHKMFAIAHYAILAILGCVVLAYDAVYAHINTDYDTPSEKLYNDSIKLLGAYYVLILVIVLYVLGLFVVWLRAMPSHQVSTGSLKAWIPLLFLFAIGLSIIRIVWVFYFILPQIHTFTEFKFRDYVAIQVLLMLTTFAIKICVVGVAAFRGFGDWNGERVYQTTSDTFEPLGVNHDMHEVVRETA